MRKKVVLPAIAIIAITVLAVIKFGVGEKTVEDVLAKGNKLPINIIHEEKTDKGVIVFYNHPRKDDLGACFIKKKMIGWKYVYGGVQGGLKISMDEYGMSWSYFPNVYETPFPLYYGIIGNTDIKQVKIVENKRKIEREAKIINAGDTRIWLIYMNRFEGSEFEIIGVSSDGKEISKVKEDISPYSAEQKPMKQ